jgi:hypothetical protein
MQWKYIKQIHFEHGRTNLNIYISDVKDTVNLDPTIILMPKSINHFFISNCCISFLKFQDETKCEKFSMHLKEKNTITWENIFIPKQTDELRFLYKGTTPMDANIIEKTNHLDNESKELLLQKFQIQSLNLSTFPHLQRVVFNNCLIQDSDNIILPKNAAIEIQYDITEDFNYVENSQKFEASNFFAKITDLKYKLQGDYSENLLSFQLAYPKTLQRLSIDFAYMNQQEIKWQESLQRGNLHNLHTVYVEMYHEFSMDFSSIENLDTVCLILLEDLHIDITLEEILNVESSQSGTLKLPSSIRKVYLVVEDTDIYAHFTSHFRLQSATYEKNGPTFQTDIINHHWYYDNLVFPDLNFEKYIIEK